MNYCYKYLIQRPAFDFKNLINFDNIPNVKPSDFIETDEINTNIQICFTNEKRKN